VLPLVVLQALASEPQHLNSPLSTATAVALIAMVAMLVTAARSLCRPCRGAIAT
jgi:hypothetical protein